MTSMNKPGWLRSWLQRDDKSRAAGGQFDQTDADEITGDGQAPRAATSGEPSNRRQPDEPAQVQLIDLDDRSFDTGTEGGATVVDFWATWCQPCTVFHPRFQHAANDHDGPVRFARVDIENNPQIAAMVGIQSIPTVALFDVDGNEVERITGVPSPSDLDRLIARGAALAEAT